jgi:hypothetical protein
LLQLKSIFNKWIDSILITLIYPLFMVLQQKKARILTCNKSDQFLWERIIKILKVKLDKKVEILLVFFCLMCKRTNIKDMREVKDTRWIRDWGVIDRHLFTCKTWSNRRHLLIIVWWTVLVTFRVCRNRFLWLIKFVVRLWIKLVDINLYFLLYLVCQNIQIKRKILTKKSS